MRYRQTWTGRSSSSTIAASTVDGDPVRLAGLCRQLAEGGAEAVVAKRDRLEREREPSEVAHDAPGPLDREPDHAARLAVLLVAEIGERRLEDQPDARDRLLRPVVQRQREASPLLLLGRQEPVGQARALALAFLGLCPQRSRERVQAPVLAGPRPEVREHPQLRELERRERRVGAPDDREIGRPEALGAHRDRADLALPVPPAGSRRRCRRA